MKRFIPGLLLSIGCLYSMLVQAETDWWGLGEKLFREVTDEQSVEEVVSNVASGFSEEEAIAAFKQALELGSQQVVQQLSAVGGFEADPKVHIPLPSELQEVARWLDKVGLERYAEELEVKLNRAAEAATPKAKQLFLNAINELTFDDVMRIYNGPEDSATQYLHEKMSGPLKQEMVPIVEQSLSEVGAVKAYDDLIEEYREMPFVPDVKADLTSHVVDLGVEGIFLYLAEQEAQIRQDPIRHTTELLKKVFGDSTSN